MIVSYEMPFVLPHFRSHSTPRNKTNRKLKANFLCIHQANAFNNGINYFFLASNFNPSPFCTFYVFYQIGLLIKVGTCYSVNFKTAFLKEATNNYRF